MPDQGERDVSFKLPGTLTSSALSRARGPASRAGQAENIHCSPASPSKRTTIFSAASRAAGQEMTVTAKDKQEALAVETDDDFILYTSPGRLEDDLRRLGSPAVRGEAPSLVLDRLRAQVPSQRGVGDESSARLRSSAWTISSIQNCSAAQYEPQSTWWDCALESRAAYAEWCTLDETFGPLMDVGRISAAHPPFMIDRRHACTKPFRTRRVSRAEGVAKGIRRRGETGRGANGCRGVGF